MEEIWTDIKGYEGEYQVSNTGKIKSLERVQARVDGKPLKIKERILNGSEDTKGYLQVEFNNGGKREIKMIHRIVAETYIPKINGKTQVNHKDGDKTNNAVENLEWVTCEENIRHAWNKGLNKPVYGESSPNHKLTNEEVRYIKEHYIPRSKQCGARALAKRFGVSPYPILRIVHGDGWRHLK